MERAAGIGRLVLLVVVACAAAACADLGGVRDFAALSTSITKSSELSARWRDSGARLKAIPQPGDVPLDISTGDRGPVHKETEKMLEAVTVYMDVMGQLAAGDLPSVSSQVAGLKDALSALPETPIPKEPVAAVGILGGVSLPVWLAKKAGIPAEVAQEIALVGVPSAIVGARLFFVFEHWDRFGDDPLKIVTGITEGGITLYGGLLGGVLGGFWATKAGTRVAGPVRAV